MDNCITDITKRIEQEHEANLEKMFMNFGFSKEYLVAHADEFHVYIFENTKTYSHNGKELFKEVGKFEISEDGTPKYIVEYIPLI